jgi:hypothetical protein
VSKNLNKVDMFRPGLPRKFHRNVAQDIDFLFIAGFASTSILLVTADTDTGKHNKRKQD